MTRTAPFSAKAIRSACFATVFAVAPAGLFGLAAIGNNITKGNVADCNNDTWAACEKLIDIKSAHHDVTNPKFKAEVAKREAQEAESAAKKAAAEREANKWQPTKTNIQQLAFACSQQKLKPFLKDPNSLRILNRGMSELTETHVTVWVDYTATNGFGGPARDVFSCTYTR